MTNQKTWRNIHQKSHHKQLSSNNHQWLHHTQCWHPKWVSFTLRHGSDNLPPPNKKIKTTNKISMIDRRRVSFLAETCAQLCNKGAIFSPWDFNAPCLNGGIKELNLHLNNHFHPRKQPKMTELNWNLFLSCSLKWYGSQLYSKFNTFSNLALHLGAYNPLSTPLNR